MQMGAEEYTQTRCCVCIHVCVCAQLCAGYKSSSRHMLGVEITASHQLLLSPYKAPPGRQHAGVLADRPQPIRDHELCYKLPHRLLSHSWLTLPCRSHRPSTALAQLKLSGSIGRFLAALLVCVCVCVLSSLESQACWLLRSVNLSAAERRLCFLLLLSWWLGRTQKVFSSDLHSFLAAHFCAVFLLLFLETRSHYLTYGGVLPIILCIQLLNSGNTGWCYMHC